MNRLLDSDIEEICAALGEDAKVFGARTVLVTGALGFIGRYFVEVLAHLNRHVLAEPCRIVAVDNLVTSTSGASDLPDDPNLVFHQHDITVPFEAGRDVDFIVHAAGIASPHYYRKWPLETMDVATNGLRNVLDLARAGGARLLYFSSSEIYGNPDVANLPTKETYNGNVSPLGERSCYDESKRFGETLTRVYATEFDVEAVIVRPFNVFGPGMRKTDYRLLPSIVGRALDDEPVDLFGDGRQTRTFCYATDAIRGFLLALLYGRPGEAYNIGTSGPEVSVLDLARRCGALEPTRGLRTRIVDYPESYPEDEPRRRCPDLAKAEGHLGYRPAVPLHEGLRRFIAWAEGAYR